MFHVEQFGEIAGKSGFLRRGYYGEMNGEDGGGLRSQRMGVTVGFAVTVESGRALPDTPPFAKSAKGRAPGFGVARIWVSQLWWLWIQ